MIQEDPIISKKDLGRIDNFVLKKILEVSQKRWYTPKKNLRMYPNTILKNPSRSFFHTAKYSQILKHEGKHEVTTSSLPQQMVNYNP